MRNTSPGSKTDFMPAVKQLYAQLLNREADPSGLEYWSEIAAQCGSLDPVRAGILASDEYRSKLDRPQQQQEKFVF
jgi:hypothetical protein